jgi:acetolactate synthase I/II/III large subunit
MTAEQNLRQRIGPYSKIADSLANAMPRDALWVRDVTVANSTWGNRLLKLLHARQGIHASGGGIGQGLPMAIGASFGASGRKIVALTGDGGLMLNAGELATAVQERVDVTVIVMNDRGYGVIRNIQDTYFSGRRQFVGLHTPNIADLGRIMGLQTWHVASLDAFGEAITQAISVKGPRIVEIDMEAIGPYPVAFAGPPPSDRS